MNQSGPLGLAWWRGVFAGAALVAMAAGGVAAAGSASVGAFVSQAAEAGSDEDELIFHNGKVVKGRIVSETATEIRFEVRLGGITAPATYQKTEILTIKRAAREEAAEGGEAMADKPVADINRAGAGAGDAGDDVDPAMFLEGGPPVVYVMPLRGWFGSDIAPQVVEAMLTDAKKFRPDYLVIELDRSWKADVFSEQVDDVGQLAKFDEFDTADEIEALLTKELPRTWDKLPHIVVWVKGAMGGAAFLPFVAEEIYFAPEARMGGIGNLGEMFEGVGDHVVRQKQRSLRLARAQGMAIAGGYDYRIVNAMAMRAYELSYRLKGGKAELFEGTATLPDEVTLTDDGGEGRGDSLIDLARGTGNDVLTLKAETAELLGVSRGTASSLDDVLAGLGILRNHRMAEGRGERIMSQWSKELDDLSRDLPRMWEDFNRVAIGVNGVDTPRELLGRRKAILEQIRAVHVRYGAAIQAPEGFGQQATPPPGWLVPGLNDIDVLLEQIRVQFMSLRD